MEYLLPEPALKKKKIETEKTRCSDGMRSIKGEKWEFKKGEIRRRKSVCMKVALGKKESKTENLICEILPTGADYVTEEKGERGCKGAKGGLGENADL